MASENGNTVAARLQNDDAESETFPTSRYVVRETVPHSGPAKYRRLYARLFGAVFSDGRNPTRLDRLAIHRDTDIGA